MNSGLSNMPQRAEPRRQGDLLRMAEDAISAKFSEMFRAFKFLDLDNSGRVSDEELRRGLRT